MKRRRGQLTIRGQARKPLAHRKVRRLLRQGSNPRRRRLRLSLRNRRRAITLCASRRFSRVLPSAAAAEDAGGAGANIAVLKAAAKRLAPATSSQ